MSAWELDEAAAQTVSLLALTSLSWVTAPCHWGALDKITKAGRRPLVKPGPLKPAVEGVTLDEQASTAV